MISFRKPYYYDLNIYSLLVSHKEVFLNLWNPFWIGHQTKWSDTFWSFWLSHYYTDQLEHWKLWHHYEQYSFYANDQVQDKLRKRKERFKIHYKF